MDAGNCFKKVDPQEAINCMMKAIEIYTDMGRFTIAAKHHMSVAEIYETECVDIEKAVVHYEQAADYYKGEESNSSANRCLLIVARYSAQLDQFQKVCTSNLRGRFKCFTEKGGYSLRGLSSAILIICIIYCLLNVVN